jgi:glycosyltransferase involved in cell wall biosynthesis
VSEFIRNEALARGFPAEKTVVHYTGIDTDVFRANPTILRGPIVLFVGRLALNKGCEYLIRAMASLQKVKPEIRLVVIGDGPLRNRLEEQASAVLGNFEFLGVQSPAVVRDWMNRATVFSVPSVTISSGEAEGFGMVFAEAQGMGLPVVSFAIGGIPEVVAHEQTGFLVPERDWEALAARLLVLLQNQDLWRQFSEAGKVRVEKLFSIRKQATILEDMYESVLMEWRVDGKMTKTRCPLPYGQELKPGLVREPSGRLNALPNAYIDLRSYTGLSFPARDTLLPMQCAESHGRERRD